MLLCLGVLFLLMLLSCHLFSMASIYLWWNIFLFLLRFLLLTTPFLWHLSFFASLCLDISDTRVLHLRCASPATSSFRNSFTSVCSRYCLCILQVCAAAFSVWVLVPLHDAAASPSEHSSPSLFQVAPFGSQKRRPLWPPLFHTVGSTGLSGRTWTRIAETSILHCLYVTRHRLVRQHTFRCSAWSVNVHHHRTAPPTAPPHYRLLGHHRQLHELQRSAMSPSANAGLFWGPKLSQSLAGSHQETAWKTAHTSLLKGPCLSLHTTVEWIAKWIASLKAKPHSQTVLLYQPWHSTLTEFSQAAAKHTKAR